MCPTRAIRIFHLRDVYVVSDALIFDRDLRLLENASVGLEPDAVRNALNAIRSALHQENMRYRKGLTVIAKRQAGRNYGHFMIEMLPLAVLRRALYGTTNPQHLVPNPKPEMLDVMFRALRLGGIRLRNLMSGNFCHGLEAGLSFHLR